MTKQYGTRVDAPIVAGADDKDDIASALGWQIKGAWQLFANLDERDRWAASFPSRRYRTTAFVVTALDGKPRVYFWSGTAEDGSDGAWVDAGLAGEAAAALEIIQDWGDKKTFDAISKLKVQYPIELVDGEGGYVAMVVKPDAYEKRKSPDWLGFLGKNHTIAGKSVPVTADIHKAGTIAFKNVVVQGGGEYLRIDSAGQQFTIQQTNDSDPNVSGGSNFLISFRISLEGNALADGSVLLYMYDASTDPFDTDNYLVDINGEPLVAAKHYKQGEPLGDLDITGIVNAKGVKQFTCHVVNSMAGFITLNDRFHGGTCLLVQDLSGEDKTGAALMQFELDTGDKLWYAIDGTTYNLRSSLSSRAVRGQFEQKYEAFIQSTQDDYGLRYSIPEEETPMPCGKATKGHADVEVDSSVNAIAGSSASGGEGAIKFLADGNAKVSTTVRLNNSTDKEQTVTFWWSYVDKNGAFTKIVGSEKQIPLLPKTHNQEAELPTFNRLVTAGDRIALKAKSSVAFGVYIQTTTAKYPLLETVVSIKEIEPFGEYEGV